MPCSALHLHQETLQLLSCPAMAPSSKSWRFLSHVPSNLTQRQGSIWPKSGTWCHSSIWSWIWWRLCLARSFWRVGSGGPQICWRSWGLSSLIDRWKGSPTEPLQYRLEYLGLNLAWWFRIGCCSKWTFGIWPSSDWPYSQPSLRLSFHWNCEASRQGSAMIEIEASAPLVN